MNDPKKFWAGPMGGLRTPFLPKTMFLGFLALAVLVGGVYVINIFAEEDCLVTRTCYFAAESVGPTAVKVFNLIYELLPGEKIANTLKLKESPDGYAMIALLIWSLFIWGIFSCAINRIVAYDIAKEESLSIKDALKFSWRYKFSILLVPLLIIILIAFLLVCNYTAGYLAQKITFLGIGAILFIPVFILVLLSTFLILFLSIGLIFGFNMVTSAIAVEKCDSVEATVSVFNYIFSRPWSYIFYHIILGISVLFIIIIGGMFIDISFSSSLISSDADIVWYRFNRNNTTVIVCSKSKVGKDIVEKEEKFYLDKKIFQKELEAYSGPEENKPKLYLAGMKDIWAYIKGTQVDSWIMNKKENETIQKLHQMLLLDLWNLDKFWACIGAILALFYFVVYYFILGYALSHIFGSTTIFYFLLRKEVDDCDYEEIIEDDDEIEILGLEAKEEKVKEDSKEEKKEDSKEEKKEEEVKDDSKEEKKEDSKEEKKEEEVKDEEKKEEEVKDEEKKEDSKEEKKEEEVKDEEKKEEEKKEDSKEEKKEEEKKEEEVKDEEKKEEEKKEEEVKDEEKKDEEKKEEEKKEEEVKDEEKKDEEKEEKKDEEKKEEEKKEEEVKDEEKKDVIKKQKDIAKTLDSGTMAIPLVKRKQGREKKKKIEDDEFMD